MKVHMTFNRRQKPVIGGPAVVYVLRWRLCSLAETRKRRGFVLKQNPLCFILTRLKLKLVDYALETALIWVNNPFQFGPTWDNTSLDHDLGLPYSIYLMMLINRKYIAALRFSSWGRTPSSPSKEKEKFPHLPFSYPLCIRLARVPLTRRSRGGVAVEEILCRILNDSVCPWVSVTLILSISDKDSANMLDTLFQNRFIFFPTQFCLFEQSPLFKEG